MTTAGFASSAAGSYYLIKALKTQMQTHEIWNSKEHLDTRERAQKYLALGATLKLTGLALLAPKIAQSKIPKFTFLALEASAGFSAFSVFCFQEAYKYHQQTVPTNNYFWKKRDEAIGMGAISCIGAMMFTMVAALEITEEDVVNHELEIC